METPTKHEQFRVIICAFRKYTTLSAGTASVSGQQTVFDGASNHKRSSVGRVSAVPERGELSLWSFLLFPQESTTCRFNHYCLSVKSNFHRLLQYFGFIFQTSIYEIDSQILIKDVFESIKIR